MTVKILKHKRWAPVKVEVTFDTREQLLSFLAVYQNAGDVTKALRDRFNFVTVENLVKLVDSQTLYELNQLANE